MYICLSNLLQCARVVQVKALENENNEIREISLMPDYENTELWMNIEKQMMEGHQKSTTRACKQVSKILVQRGFFLDAAQLAKDQQEFWKTIEEVAQYELHILNKRNEQKNTKIIEA